MYHIIRAPALQLYNVSWAWGPAQLGRRHKVGSRGCIWAPICRILSRSDNPKMVNFREIFGKATAVRPGCDRPCDSGASAGGESRR